MIAYLQKLLENHSQVQHPPWPAPDESGLGVVTSLLSGIWKLLQISLGELKMKMEGKAVITLTVGV